MNNIKILVIGNDALLLDGQSNSYERALTYSSLVEKYDVVTVAKTSSELIVNEGFRVFGVNSVCKIITYIKLWVKINNLGKYNHYDLVTTQDPFEFGLLGYLFAKKYKCVLQLQVHGDFFDNKYQYWKKLSLINQVKYLLGKFLITKADNIRVVSKRIYNSLIDLQVSPNNISVVPVVFNQPALTSEKKYNSELKLIFVGRLAKEKNILMLLRSVNECFKNNIKLNLRIVGDGEEKEKIKKFIVDNNLTGNVELISWANNLDAQYLWADIIVLCSWYEGWGRVIIDAGAYGVVPVMTNVGCAGELVVNNKNGLVVECNDEVGLQNAIMVLNNNHDQLHQMSNSIKETIDVYLKNYNYLDKLVESWMLTINNFKKV